MTTQGEERVPGGTLTILADRHAAVVAAVDAAAVAGNEPDVVERKTPPSSAKLIPRRLRMCSRAQQQLLRRDFLYGTPLQHPHPTVKCSLLLASPGLR